MVFSHYGAEFMKISKMANSFRISGAICLNFSRFYVIPPTISHEMKPLSDGLFIILFY